MFSNQKRKQKKLPSTSKRQKREQDENIPSTGCSTVKTLSEAKGTLENTSFSELNYEMMADLFKGSDFIEVSRILQDSPSDNVIFSNESQIKVSSPLNFSPSKIQKESNEILSSTAASSPVQFSPSKESSSSTTVTKSSQKQESLSDNASNVNISKTDVIRIDTEDCDVGANVPVERVGEFIIFPFQELQQQLETFPPVININTSEPTKVLTGNGNNANEYVNVSEIKKLLNSPSRTTSIIYPEETSFTMINKSLSAGDDINKEIKSATTPNVLNFSIDNEDTSSQSIIISFDAIESFPNTEWTKQIVQPEIFKETKTLHLQDSPICQAEPRNVASDSDLTDCESPVQHPNSSSKTTSILESILPGTSRVFDMVSNNENSCKTPTQEADELSNKSGSEEELEDVSDADPIYQHASTNNESSGSDSDDSLSSHSETEFTAHTRKRKANPAGWKRNKAKALRNSGQSYKTLKKGNLVPSRTMGPPCGSSCRLRCNEKISGQERQEYFDSYWSLKDINKQRHVISKSMLAIQPKYRYPKRNSTRNINHAFYLHKENDKIRVCKKFFTSTLGITNRCIRTVLKKTKNGFVADDLRGKHDNHYKVDEETKNRARNHIASIPTVESHYTRADSTKKYIEGGRTLTDIYRDYKVDCTKENQPFVTFSIFRQIFNYEFNLEFFKPKKDLCQYCESYKNMGHDEKLDRELEYMRHHEEKNLSRAEKDEDKRKVTKKYKVACYDLQAALPTPKGEVSTFYYKSKLSTYNFTICDLNQKGLGTVNCYLWHEGEGNKGSNEIGSSILHYLENCASVDDGENGVETPDGTEVIFYSDNCGGQGKNKYIIGAYLYAVSNFNIKSITHKFLVVGHTQNEGDVVHSLIEKNIKKALNAGPIYLPSQYATLVSTARKSGEPFKVHELDHEFFHDFKDLIESTSTNFNINDDGEKFNFNDICVIRVEKENPGIYFYKTSFKDEEYKTVNVTQARTRKQLTQQLTLFKDVNLKKAYSDSIPISQRKYQDLTSLVTSNTIPRCHAGFFENLKHD